MKRFIKFIKRAVLLFLVLVVLFLMVAFFYMKQAKFGQDPSGDRLSRIERSANYKNGKFVNLVEKPVITEGYSILSEIYKTVFESTPNKEPKSALPYVQTDLKKLPADSNLMVWFGHSSVYIQVSGKRLLIDPVFSGNASPIPGSVKAYEGTNTYSAEDMPGIDYLFISHDHYDHLDYETIVKLKDKVKHVVCGLGVGAHFELWGYKPEQLIELDWNEKAEPEPGFTLLGASSHHDSGRSLRNAKTLWMAFLIITPEMKIYYSGDGGYDDRFTKLGNEYGPIDWALMECGQYNKAWQSVHKLPEEVMRSTLDIKAKNMLPVHHSKFTLARHDWNEPLIKISELSKNKNYHLATPKIGEVVWLNNSTQKFDTWWEM